MYNKEKPISIKYGIDEQEYDDEEREKFAELLEIGFIDTYRYFYLDKKDSYTWWSYIKNVHKKNIGWRIDYFLVSKRFIYNVTKTTIYSCFRK